MLIGNMVVAEPQVLSKSVWNPSGNFTDGLGISVQWRGIMESSATVTPMPTAVIQGQIDDIVSMGLKIVRIDNHWEWKDELKEQYDFSEHHRVVDLCHHNGLRVLTILSFKDRRFEKTKGFSIKTIQGSQTYEEFCARIVKEFKGQGIIWEMWNEPNSQPWVSIADAKKVRVANAEAYMSVVTKAISAMRLADPDCIIVGPGLAGFDPAFMEGCLNKGLLEYVDAVSIHPYHLRHLGAEVNSLRYEKLRSMMDAYNRLNGGERPLPPVINSEIGYTQVLSPGNLHTQDQQAARVVRSILMAQVEEIPLHIIYTNLDRLHGLMKEAESSFGVLTYDGKPKSGYYAVKTIISQLSGFKFKKRLLSGTLDPFKTLPEDYSILFSQGDKTIVVAWTSAPPHMAKVEVPRYSTITDLVDMKGKKIIPLPKVITGTNANEPGSLVKMKLTSEPVYIKLNR